MNLNHLQYFLETCRYGSITKASEVCHISQPSITCGIFLQLFARSFVNGIKKNDANVKFSENESRN